jgi:hypothetical protein
MADAFAARRVVRSFRQTIDGPPEIVFPLLCPVREVEWLDGWAYTMIYSASGLVERGAVFSTAKEGEEDTVWIVTRHDAANHVVEFTRFTPGSRTCILRIVVTPFDVECSHVDITYSYTSIAPPGNRFLDEWSEEQFVDALRFWERSMNHFLKTGNRLARRH